MAKRYHREGMGGLKSRPKSGRWGFKQKAPRKVHANTATRGEKDDLKKRPPIHLWVNRYKMKVLQVSLDESFFFCDSMVRRIFWIDEKKRPVARVTGSHKYTNLSVWCSEMECKQLFGHCDS